MGRREKGDEKENAQPGAAVKKTQKSYLLENLDIGVKPTKPHAFSDSKPGEAMSLTKQFMIK